MDYYEYAKPSCKYGKPTFEILQMMEDLNYYHGEGYELKWAGKNHCRYLTNFGTLVCFGTKRIWEHLYLALDSKRRASR